MPNPFEVKAEQKTYEFLAWVRAYWGTPLIRKHPSAAFRAKFRNGYIVDGWVNGGEGNLTIILHVWKPCAAVIREHNLRAPFDGRALAKYEKFLAELRREIANDGNQTLAQKR